MEEKKLVELLGLAAGGCSCESYYRYTCELCRVVGREDPTMWRYLVDAGLVQHGGYAPYELTLSGAILLFRKKGRQGPIRYYDLPTTEIPRRDFGRREHVLVDGQPWEPNR